VRYRNPTYASLRAAMSARPISASGSRGAPPRRYAPRMPPEQRREQLVDAALSVIIEQGYGGVSIEAIARAAGVTRPVVYDHFANLGRLLHALVEREEQYALEQLARVVPDDPADGDPVEVLAGSVRRFLDAVVARPATWRIILLPLDGTPAIVREHVETHRGRILERIERLVRWAVDRGELPREIDVELASRAIRDLGEEAGRMVLTDPDRYSPDRYERFVETVMKLLLPA
jgi:AcrR family transcriptional regulator